MIFKKKPTEEPLCPSCAHRYSMRSYTPFTCCHKDDNQVTMRQDGILKIIENKAICGCDLTWEEIKLNLKTLKKWTYGNQLWLDCYNDNFAIYGGV